MKKNLQLSFLLLSLLLITVLPSWTHQKKGREFYELTVYHFATPAQEKILDDYFQNALVPALHRQQIKTVGVFKSWSNDTTADKRMYVFIPLSSLDAVEKVREHLKQDRAYETAAAACLDADYKNPAFTRKETILLQAFPLAPQMHLPKLQAPKHDRVYELRSYESPTEKKFQSKVKMFNQGDEIGIFSRLNFNPVFYSEVIAGSKMPNLMYMTSFENRADREAHWKSFGSDTAWKKLSALPEYQNNVSHMDINFLYPADYSDF